MILSSATILDNIVVTAKIVSGGQVTINYSDGITEVEKVNVGGNYNIPTHKIYASNGVDVLSEDEFNEDYTLLESIAIAISLNTVFYKNTAIDLDIPVLDSTGVAVGTVDPGVKIAIANSSIKDSAGLELHSVRAEQPETITDSTVNVKDSAGTILYAKTVKAENTENQTVNDTTILAKNSENTTIGTGTFKAEENGNIAVSDITITLNTGGTTPWPSGKNYTETAQIQTVFLKGVFGIGIDTLPILTIDADNAGTFTSASDDGSSGSLTYSINGGGYAAFSNPTVLGIGDTIIAKRTVTTDVGYFKFSGTY